MIAPVEKSIELPALRDIDASIFDPQDPEEAVLPDWLSSAEVQAASEQVRTQKGTPVTVTFRSLVDSRHQGLQHL